MSSPSGVVIRPRRVVLEPVDRGEPLAGEVAQRRVPRRRCGPCRRPPVCRMRRRGPTAPTTFGEPASWRSGSSAHSVSSIVTSFTAPPPRRNGSPEDSQSRSPISAPGAVRRIQLVAGEREDSRCRRAACRSARAAPAEPRRRAAARRTVRDPRDLGERPHLSGDVLCAGHGHEVRVLAVGQLARGSWRAARASRRATRARADIARRSASMAAGWRGARRRRRRRACPRGACRPGG